VHGSRSDDSTGACVFYAFPDESIRIAKEKPGMLPFFETMLTGIEYQIENFVAADLDVKVVEIIIEKAGKRVVRKALCADVMGAKHPKPPYPSDMIALVAQYALQPKVGNYKASIRKFSDAAWSCVLADA
jgi:hypothetical protein